MQDDTEEAGLDRREFMTDAAGAAGLATVAYFWFEGFGEASRRQDVEPTAPGAPPQTFTAQEWRTLEAACDRLLPTAPDAPGAASVNAIGYLDAVLQQPHILPETVPLIRAGAAKLDERARKMGVQEFRALDEDKQDGAIRVFEVWKLPDGTYPGHPFLKKMLSFILEAFFGDPIHGGNPDEIAWKWAGHKPGFPRPTEPNWRPVERT
jgi:gluconate 2-dehydrogenase gamma chain